MAAYTGWGSFGQELFQGNWENQRPKEGWEKEDAWLREHLGKRKMLSDLEADLLANPTPAPEWLLNGAPVGSEVYVEGKPATVEGHRNNNEGTFVVTDKGTFKIDKVTDMNGIPLFDKTSAPDIKMSAGKDDLQQQYRNLMDEGVSRSHALDVLVDDYEPAQYNPNNGVPGFAQHESITDEYLGKLRTILSQYSEAGKTKDTIVKQLYQRYNEFKGNRKHSTDLVKTVDKMAFLKGVMWHVSKENDIFGIEPDTGRTGAGKLLRTPWERFFNGVFGSSRERRFNESTKKGIGINKKTRWSSGRFLLHDPQVLPIVAGSADRLTTNQKATRERLIHI